jgi:hypothetical protein
MTRTPTALSRAIDAFLAKDGERLQEIGFSGVHCFNRRLSQGEKEMLARLRASKEAAEAFVAWELSDDKGSIFIRDCVVAHRYYNPSRSRYLLKDVVFCPRSRHPNGSRRI